MKKIISVFLISACSLAMAIPVQAQLIKWGVKGGVNLSKIDIDGGYKGNKDNNSGFFVGPMAELTIPIIGLGVDGALLFSQKKTDLSDNSLKQTGVEIPVNLKYTIGMGSAFGLYFAAGPDFFFDFTGDKTISDYDITKKTSQVGLNLGAGLKLLRHLQVGVNYQIPMGDSFTWKNTKEAIDGNGKTKTWQISAAYIF